MQDLYESQQEHLAYFDYADLEEKEDLGRGSFGIVKRGYWKDVEVAIKSVEASQKDILHELALMASLPPHPNVIRLYGVCLRPKIRIILEYINGGSLDKHLPPFQTNIPHLLRAARDISLGMAHLHKNGIIHGDLATRNILIQTSPTTEIFKISDFGLSRFDHSTNEFQSKLPLKWMAPENIPGKDGTVKYKKKVMCGCLQIPSSSSFWENLIRSLTICRMNKFLAPKFEILDIIPKGHHPVRIKSGIYFCDAG
eukprot:TRINITY_DN143_c0_g1_i3.p1 TRINITY_DN143_c0_g1~~TRINITY_DN143_c0_g1_i3.p1  ORF type:complete len:254 (+),score=40.03 TRINITY_DN143_c0_g1_i3:180-941(+)